MQFHSDDETDHPTGSPTADKYFAELEDSQRFGKNVDKVIIGLSVVAVVGVLGMLIVSSIRRRWGGATYTNMSDDSSSAVRPKRSMFKKFEDYWDEESEDQSTRNTSSSAAGAGGGNKASTNYDDYWDEKNDLSTHSNHPLNISLPKRT
jgi:hypothetical protein